MLIHLLQLQRSSSCNPPRSSKKRGLSLVEIAIAMVILSVCCGMLTSTIAGTMRHNNVKRERLIAIEAARATIEDMHNVDFYDVFTSFNRDPADDKDGVGTAPGAHFAVEGLKPTDDDPDGFVGEILLPAAMAPLLENIEDVDLGLPRDLNGDLQIDDVDHTGDYIILPVIIQLRWKSISGDSEFKLCTMLADIRKVE